MKPSELDALVAEIEHRRMELNNLGKVLGARHPDVLAKSEQLDRLILEHVKAQLQNKKPNP